MLQKIINIFKNKSIENILSNKIKEIHSLIPLDFGGGCSHQKALIMSFVISKHDIKKTADIGVYKGRSLFPQAIAHQLFSKGMAYGIDPYSNEAAVQNDRPDLQIELDEFVKITDFEMLYNEVSDIVRNNYENNCILIRKKSSEAILDFKKNNIKFGLVHIDGNHDTTFVMEDVNNYFPLLEEKSFIVLDDISWDSVKPAFSLLNKEMVFIGELKDTTNDFALFGKGLSGDEVLEIKTTFKRVEKHKK